MAASLAEIEIEGGIGIIIHAEGSRA